VLAPLHIPHPPSPNLQNSQVTPNLWIPPASTRHLSCLHPPLPADDINTDTKRQLELAAVARAAQMANMQSNPLAVNQGPVI